jgi:hypothetical protein
MSNEPSPLYGGWLGGESTTPFFRWPHLVRSTGKRTPTQAARESAMKAMFACVCAISELRPIGFDAGADGSPTAWFFRRPHVVRITSEPGQGR